MRINTKVRVTRNIMEKWENNICVPKNRKGIVIKDYELKKQSKVQFDEIIECSNCQYENKFWVWIWDEDLEVI